MKTSILLYGAGAIGRGYLPWLFDFESTDIYFVDVDKDLINYLNKKKEATSFMAHKGEIEKLRFPVKGALFPNQLSQFKEDQFDLIFLQVGPRNCLQALDSISNFKAPIILSENDAQLVEKARNKGFKKVYFAVPDVITSNCAPNSMKAEDPYAVITENGQMFIDSGAKSPILLHSNRVTFLDEKQLILQQWTPKLFIHNTPHCIAAYLGALVGKTYLHETMEVPQLSRIVEGAMREMLTSLKLNWDIDHSFLDWYAEKELERFSNKLLFDPIKRVAREPLRKLALEGRLMGAANMCLSQEFIPKNILLGIISAIMFNDPEDPDHQFFYLSNYLKPKQIFTQILGLRDGEALERVLSYHYQTYFSKLSSIRKQIISSEGKSI